LITAKNYVQASHIQVVPMQFVPVKKLVLKQSSPTITAIQVLRII